MEELTRTEMLLRLGSALVAGFVVGLERERRGRAAGLRTTILTTTAAALAMVLSEILFHQSAQQAGPGTWRPDPARLAAGILTGIGFLGAGTILRHENVIRGVTTAATIWFMTVLGLAFGAGEYLLGYLGTVLAFVVLTAFPAVEHHLQRDRYAHLTLVSRLEAVDTAAARELIEALGPQIKGFRVEHDLAEGLKTLSFELKVHRPDLEKISNKLVAEFSSRPGVIKVRWE